MYSKPEVESKENDLQERHGQGIPRLSLASAVAEKLREMIIKGQIEEGEQLRQDVIATDLNVSRIPVREAMRQLDAEGLIRIVPHHGAVVAALSADEIGELFDIRVLLECEVLRCSIPNLKESDFQKAEAILRRYENALEMNEEVAKWGQLNWQFHSTLYSRAERPRFMAMIQQINNNSDRYMRLQLYLTREFSRANEQHRTLLELCRNRDTDAACALLELHIRNAGRSLKEFIRKRNS
jgi:DNA-binding GntR family transcriptional regulator